MSSMIDVLEQHLKQNIRGCMCGWAEIGRSHTAHVADELSKAGYGDLEEVWDHGHESGFWNGRLSQLTVPYDAPTPDIGVSHAKVANPYRRGQST